LHTWTAKELTESAGLVPAENTSKSGFNDFKIPSAIWLLQEFPVQIINIFINNFYLLNPKKNDLNAFCTRGQNY
jgi:hypothetical protein